MACLNFQNNYFRKHLLMAAIIRFRSTCFSEHLKKDALFIKQPSYFFLGIRLFKESPKEIRTFILNSMIRGNSIIAFHHVFHHSRRHSPKNFSLLEKHKDFGFFRATLSSLNIIYIKLIYFNKRLVWVYIRKTKLQ